MKYYPEYRIGTVWYRWQSRGKNVSFDTEQEAQEFLIGICGDTRVTKEI